MVYPVFGIIYGKFSYPDHIDGFTLISHQVKLSLDSPSPLPLLDDMMGTGTRCGKRNCSTESCLICLRPV